MSVPPGSRLGPYEIVAPLGAGGMGEVYKARDTRLERSVAIKILPHEFAANAQLRLRFEREAKTISQLEHPHICRLYDVGEDTSNSAVQYLVMELLEGESLADRLARGPMPVDEVLRHGAEIAGALAQAHAHGVVHRDFKPGNVMLTKSGAKLLDFGLAKGSSEVAVAPPLSQDGPTHFRPLTQEGTILGTFQYMAPEQLAGEEADARSDIFALGAVIYEMATGRRAFEGNTRTSLIAAIVGGEPRPLKELQPLTPPALEHVIAKCLAKDPERRWQSASDVADELQWIAQAGSTAGVAAPIAGWRRKRERLAWALHLLTATVAVAAAWVWFTVREPPRPVIETNILPPPGQTISIGAGGFTVAPDASAVVLVLNDMKGGRSLCVRSVADSAFRLLSGTDDASYPFWSPDSRKIAFFAAGKLKIIDAVGGSVQTIADAPAGRGGTWARDGTIVFAPNTRGALSRVPAAGGVPVPVSTLAKSDLFHRWPSFLPDGEHFLFAAGNRRTTGIYLGSTSDPSMRQPVLPSSWWALAVQNGWMLYARGDSMVAQRIDGSGHLRGDPVVLADAVAATGVGSFVATCSDAGTFLYTRGLGFPASQLEWVDRTGQTIDMISEKATFFCPLLSRDGRRVAVDISEPTSGQGDIWIYDLVHKRPTRLTYDPGNESSPQWSSDDKQIMYTGDANAVDDIFQISAGGIGEPVKIFADDQFKRSTGWSRDGRWLVFNSGPGRNSANTDIWIYSVADKSARAWLATPFSERSGILSPDAKWIAYESNESGRPEIYVRAFPESDEKWLISSGGGRTPAWRGDGRELYYLSLDQKLMAVKVTPGQVFDSDVPVPLFSVRLREHVARQYDVSPDGSRFLLNQQVEDRMPQPITVVQNWTSRAER